MKNSDVIKSLLFAAVNEIAADPGKYAVNPGRDFTRNRKMGFHDTLLLLLTMEADCIKEGKQVIIRTLTPKNKPSFSGGFNVIFLYKALLAILWTRAEADPVLPLLEMVPSGAAVPVHM